MAPVTPPAHHPTRPPVVSQQEAGQDRRARWWAGGGRGHCGRGFATGCCLGARDRCKTHNTSRQPRGGGGEKGRGDKPSQTADRPKPPPNKKPETRKNRPRQKHKQALWPTEKQKPKKTTTGKTRGESHAVYRKSMKEKTASEMIVKSSVVPKQKPGKQKNTEKTASNSSRRGQSNSRKKQVASQPALPPRKQKEGDKKRT